MRPAGVLPCLLAPLPALALGIGVMRAAGVPTMLWGQHVGAFAIGAVLCFAIARARLTERKLYVAGGLALAIVAATLLVPGIEGVHRWVKLGPVRLHAGAVVLPLLLVVIAGLERLGKRVASTLLALGAALVTFAQPDAAQATAFAAGAVVLVLAYDGRRGWLRAVPLALLAGATWLRADPLLEVPHVEGIVGLAAGLGAGWAVAAIASLLLLPAPFLASRAPAALALGAYVAATILAAAVGSFPVPILGYGASPIIGYLAACGLLLRTESA